MSMKPASLPSLQEQGYSRQLPAACKDALDAEGVVRGKTWRTMSGGMANSQEIRAMNWFLWKRGIDASEALQNASQRARRDAWADMGLFGEEAAA